jgi:D-inositol-3-phosphate glycosyltransferase
VYVRELARELSRMGVAADVFTRSQNASIPRVVPLAERARVIHLPAGPQTPLPRARIHAHLPEFVAGVEAWRRAEEVDYDLVHANYWLSGVVGLALRDRWRVPLVQMFHTLGRLKNHARVATETEPPLRIAEERRIVAEADRLVAANAIERGQLVREYDGDPGKIAVIPCGVDTALFADQGPRDAARRDGLPAWGGAADALDRRRRRRGRPAGPPRDGAPSPGRAAGTG